MPLEKVSLDKRTFETLASETRIDILKRLDSRRMTITELSKELSLAKSTVHEHLTKMIDSGLVKKNDNGYKWVYYELTPKGSEILHPHETTIFTILLSSSILALIGGLWSIYRFLVDTKIRPDDALRAVPTHDPIYIFFGVTLISISLLLSFLAFRMRSK